MEDFADVLINIREPFNKNTLWIYPGKDGVIEIRVFNKGWKTIATTKDFGLSSISKKQVNDLVNSVDTHVTDRLKKCLGDFNSGIIVLQKKERELKTRIEELEKKMEKLTKRYTTLVNKLN